LRTKRVLGLNGALCRISIGFLPKTKTPPVSIIVSRDVKSFLF
jgi:hypothetical protein